MGAAQRDARKNRLQSRARALLVTEISGLENLFSSTPKGSADRVQLARRLAEDYVELESTAFREKTQAEIDRDSLKKTNPSAAGQKQTAAVQATSIMNRARTQAEKYYGIITTDYPNYPQLDEVLYYLAYEYEQANENDKARTVYGTLIQTRPNSKYIPNAYLAFGELFFNQAQGDPSKWDFRCPGLPEGHRVSAAGQQGLRVRLVQARLRLLERGGFRASAERLQEDDRLRHDLCAAAERLEARR